MRDNMNMKRITGIIFAFFLALSAIFRMSAADALSSEKTKFEETDEIHFYLEVVDDKLEPLEEVTLVTMNLTLPPPQFQESYLIPYSDPQETIINGKTNWMMKYNQSWKISLEKEGYYPVHLKIEPRSCNNKLKNTSNCYELYQKVILVRKGEAKLKEKIVLLAEDYASGVSLKKELTAFRPNNELPIEKHLDIILPISVDEFVKLEQPKELPTFLNIRLSSGNDDGFILVDSELYNNIRSLTLAPENGYQQEIEVDLTSQKDIYGYFKFNGIYGKMKMMCPVIVPKGAAIRIFFFYTEGGGRDLRSSVIDKADDW